MTHPFLAHSGRSSRVPPADPGAVALAVEPRARTETSSPSDDVLLARVRAGDAQALEALLERYWPAIFAFVLRRTGSRDAAADIAQDVFCRFWERRARWGARGSLRGLLFRLARNTAVSHHRRRRAHERATVGFAELYLDRAPAVLPAERAELRAALARAIGALPARRREVFQLRMLDDLSYDEIAEVMGISKQTVANQLSHALMALRLALAYLLD